MLVVWTFQYDLRLESRFCWMIANCSTECLKNFENNSIWNFQKMWQVLSSNLCEIHLLSLIPLCPVSPLTANCKFQVIASPGRCTGISVFRKNIAYLPNNLFQHFEHSWKNIGISTNPSKYDSTWLNPKLFMYFIDKLTTCVNEISVPTVQIEGYIKSSAHWR